MPEQAEKIKDALGFGGVEDEAALMGGFEVVEVAFAGQFDPFAGDDPARDYVAGIFFGGRGGFAGQGRGLGN